jgi:hypothetical protein
MNAIPFYFVICAVFLAGTFDKLYVAEPRRVDARAIAVFSVALISMVALASFRAVGVGSDDTSYLEIFHKVPHILDCQGLLCGYKYEDLNVEFGFFLLLVLLRIIGTSAIVLFSAVALLSVVINLRTIRYYAINFSAGAMVYFCHFFIVKDMNAIRVGLATAIAFNATIFLYERRVWPFVALTLVASLFHVSALLTFVPALFLLFKPNRKTFIVAAITIVGIAATIHLSRLLIPLIGLGFIGYKLALYSGADMYNYAVPLLDIVNLRNLGITVICLLFWDDLCKYSDKFKFAFYFFFSATFFRILFGDFAIIAGRGYSAISMFEYIIIPIVFMYLLGKRFGYLSVFAFSLATLTLNLFVSKSWMGGVPYFG